MISQKRSFFALMKQHLAAEESIYARSLRSRGGLILSLKLLTRPVWIHVCLFTYGVVPISMTTLSDVNSLFDELMSELLTAFATR